MYTFIYLTRTITKIWPFKTAYARIFVIGSTVALNSFPLKTALSLRIGKEKTEICTIEENHNFLIFATDGLFAALETL